MSRQDPFVAPKGEVLDEGYNPVYLRESVTINYEDDSQITQEFARVASDLCFWTRQHADAVKRHQDAKMASKVAHAVAWDTATRTTPGLGWSSAYR